MSGRVEKKCLCGHFEIDHKYRDCSAQALLDMFAKQQDVEVLRDPDRMQILGYQLKNGTYFTYEQALAEVERSRNEHSYCMTNLFEKTCNCEVFKTDNLKYLEDLSRERPAS